MIVYSYIDRFERKISKSKDAPKEIYSDCGKNIGTEYEYRTIEGIKKLTPCGEIDRQEYISSFEDDCDIVKNIQKFINGDTSVMNPSRGVYGDFTNMPKTYAEMFDHVQKCRNVFDSMPVEIKEKFDNSYENFWSQFGTDRFDTVFNDYLGSNEIEAADPVKESEVRQDA